MRANESSSGFVEIQALICLTLIKESTGGMNSTGFISFLISGTDRLEVTFLFDLHPHSKNVVTSIAAENIRIKHLSL